MREKVLMVFMIERCVPPAHVSMSQDNYNMSRCAARGVPAEREAKGPGSRRSDGRRGSRWRMPGHGIRTPACAGWRGSPRGCTPPAWQGWCRTPFHGLIRVIFPTKSNRLGLRSSMKVLILMSCLVQRFTSLRVSVMVPRAGRVLEVQLTAFHVGPWARRRRS